MPGRTGRGRGPTPQLQLRGKMNRTKDEGRPSRLWRDWDDGRCKDRRKREDRPFGTWKKEDRSLCSLGRPFALLIRAM